MDYYSWIESLRQETGNGKDYEGTAIYVFCENENDSEHARRLSAQNTQDRVVIAIPKNAISVFDAIFTLNALNDIKKSKDYEIIWSLRDGTD